MGATSDTIFDALTADANAGFVSPLTADAAKKIRAWCDAIATAIDGGGPGPGGASWTKEIFTAHLDAFTLAHSAVTGSEFVMLNGQTLEGAGADYAIVGTTLTLVAPLSGSDRLVVRYQYT